MQIFQKVLAKEIKKGNFLLLTEGRIMKFHKMSEEDYSDNKSIEGEVIDINTGVVRHTKGLNCFALGASDLVVREYEVVGLMDSKFDKEKIRETRDRLIYRITRFFDEEIRI